MEKGKINCQLMDLARMNLRIEIKEKEDLLLYHHRL